VAHVTVSRFGLRPGRRKSFFPTGPNRSSVVEEEAVDVKLGGAGALHVDLHADFRASDREVGRDRNDNAVPLAGEDLIEVVAARAPSVVLARTILGVGVRSSSFGPSGS